ncbi:hypothetical protein ACFLYR_09355 [Chloroflexota bacterium]
MLHVTPLPLACAVSQVHVDTAKPGEEFKLISPQVGMFPGRPRLLAWPPPAGIALSDGAI